jgi:hypothetical protein
MPSRPSNFQTTLVGLIAGMQSTANHLERYQSRTTIKWTTAKAALTGFCRARPVQHPAPNPKWTAYAQTSREILSALDIRLFAMTTPSRQGPKK